MSRIAEDWLVWLAANLLQDEPREALERVLVERGLTADEASRELDDLLASPFYRAAHGAVRAPSLAQRLRTAHLRLAPRAIQRRTGLSAEDLLVQHVAAQVPVILPDLTEGWPARDWTWAGLREAHGDRVIHACVGRTGAVLPDRRWQALQREMPFAELIDRVTDPSVGNDVFVVANNQALEGPLAPLLGDARPVPGVLPSHRMTETSTWIGGAGAHTPLHHDTSDILLCAFLGRKRVRLVPPEEMEVTRGADAFWGPDVDLDDPELVVREGVVEPGETLLIPSGWWHEVWCVDPAITLTFAGLMHPNSYRWYRPGFPPGPVPED